LTAVTAHVEEIAEVDDSNHWKEGYLLFGKHNFPIFESPTGRYSLKFGQCNAEMTPLLTTL
jgi:hypothetical protein